MKSGATFFLLGLLALWAQLPPAAGVSTLLSLLCPSDLCRLPADPGACYAMIPHWFHDWQKCEEFSYGGCRGNKNNFETKVDCLQACAGQGKTYDNLGDRSSQSWSHKLCSCSPTLIIKKLKQKEITQPPLLHSCSLATNHHLHAVR
uniref:BPTI/Kunitz inhibitor domain-containing protein n=1 Tax=Gopherus evgoodei TaxID=1825980 RepID=A0A8C4XZM3_9SAUR